MKKILALVLALVLAMALSLTAVADGEIVNVMYGGGTPESMDPALNSASTGSNLIRLAFSGLMGNRVVDGVATKDTTVEKLEQELFLNDLAWKLKG